MFGVPGELLNFNLQGLQCYCNAGLIDFHYCELFFPSILQLAFSSINYWGFGVGGLPLFLLDKKGGNRVFNTREKSGVCCNKCVL